MNQKEDERWNQYKKSLEEIPSYLVLQRASEIVFDYSDTKRPLGISWQDKEDDFVILWQKLEQISNDLDKITVIDKALKTVRDFSKD